MKNGTGAHRVIDVLCFAVFAVFIVSGFSSCEDTCYDGEKNNDEEQVDCGGSCVPCDTTGGTCFDGILNQGEEDVDCGGPCNDCIPDTVVIAPNFVCEGTGGSSYLPLTVGNYWIYALPGTGWFQWSISETTQQNNGETYFHVITTGTFGTVHNYYREAGGEIYEWNTTTLVEDVFIPASPMAGAYWINSGGDSIVVNSIDETINSQNGCVYDGLLQITTHAGSGQNTNYYKRGLGMVESSSVSAVLDSAVVY